MDYTVDYVRIAVLTPYDKVLTFLDNKVANAMHYYDDVLHTYLKGSTYTYEFKTLTDYEDAVYLVEGNKLSFKYKDKGYYMTIMNVEKGGEETTVTAYGLCLELTNEMVDAYKASRAMSFVEYVNAYGFDDSFTIGKNEVSDKRITHEWTGQDTILARLYSIANVFDAELEFVTELNDDYSLKRVVLNVYRAHSDSVQGLGKDRTGTILRYPSDIHSITKTSDITELYTGIRPTGTDGLQLNSISGRTVKDSNGNTLYYVSGNNLLAPQARDRFPSSLLTSHNNDMYAVEIWSYDTNNVETLYGQALAELKKHVNPKVEYDIDAYIDAGIGDTFTIEDAEYNPVLYLEARITEQEISFTDKTKCKTVFDNFEEIQSQISSALLSEMNKLIEAKKLYDCSIISDKGLFLKNDSDITVLQAQVKDNGKDVTSDFIFKWYKNNSEYTTNDSINVKGSEVADATVYRYEAIKNNVVRGTCEVTVCRVLDGQDGVNAYLHIAYANSGDGLLDFSLTDSNRKFIGQYTDSNQYSSEDASMYRWSAIKGEDGQSLVDYVQQFYYSDSNEEPTGGEWFETSPEWQKGKFLWKRYKATYENPDEIKYTKAIYDPTWNQLDQKIGEIQWDVDVAKNTSAEAVTKATEASDLSQEAKDLATSANSKSDDAVSKAEEANTSTANANKEIDKINTSISDAKKDIQSALDQANANSDEIGTIKETYSTKVETDKVKADLSTEITTKVGELSTSVSENYATKNDVVEIEGNLNTKITQNADSISSTASKVEKLESDTMQAQKDINDAMAKANQAQTDASTAQDLANKAQSTADSASTALNEANEKLETAQTKLTTAEDNLAKIKTQVDATEKEVADAQEKVANAQAQVEQAQKDVEQAQSTASTAVANAKAAQTTADDAKTKAEKAQSDLATLTNRVTSAETSIKQNSEQITINANKTTEVSNKVNNLKVGGRNLLANTNNGKEGWAYATSNGECSLETYNVTGVRFICTKQATGWQFIAYQPGNTQLKLLKPNTDYVISFDACCSIDLTNRMVCICKSDATMYLSNKGLWSLKASDVWTKVSVAIRTNDLSNKIDNQIIYFNDTNIGIKTLCIKNLKLEEGNTPTDWTPAPEDTDSAINSINNNIQNNYYNKTQTDAQIKASADSINLTVSEVSKTVTTANTNASNALSKANTASTNASSALTKANDLTTRANNGEFDGRGVASTKVEYQASTSGTTVPTSTWSTTIPTVANGSYLWTRTTITYTDKTTSISYSVARMGTNGAKGDKGDTGTTGLQALQSKRNWSGTYTTIGQSATASTGDFNRIPVVGDTFTNLDGSSNTGTWQVTAISGTTVTIKLLSYVNSKGATGATGKGIKSTSVTYQAWKDGTTTPTGTWSSTPPATTASAPYMWTKTVITYTDNTTSTSYSVGSTPDSIKVGGRNLILNSKGNVKAGFFKNFNTVTDGYGEVTLKSKKTYVNISISDGFLLKCRDYEVGSTVTMSYDIMYTAWNFPTGTNRNELWIGQRYTNIPSGQTGTGAWTGVTMHSLPVVGSGGCELNKWFHVKKTMTIPTQASSNIGEAASIQLYNSNADVEASFTARIKNVKLEYGNVATDWTPAPEDVEQNTYDSINAAIDASEKSTEQKYVSLINETSKKLELLVQQLETTTTKNSTSITDISNRLQITSEMAQFVKTTTEQLEDMVNGKMSSSEIRQWARFDGANLELGASDQPFKCKLSTTELAFYQNENKVAWISNNELHVLRAIIAESIGCGNFKFIDEGDLGFSLI